MKNTLIHATCWHFGRVSLDRVPGIHGVFAILLGHRIRGVFTFAGITRRRCIMRRMTSTPPCTPGNAGGRTFATPREKITVETTAAGEQLRIPCGTNERPLPFPMPVKSAAKWRHQDFSESLLADGQGIANW